MPNNKQPGIKTYVKMVAYNKAEHHIHETPACECPVMFLWLQREGGALSYSGRFPFRSAAAEPAGQPTLGGPLLHTCTDIQRAMPSLSPATSRAPAAVGVFLYPLPYPSRHICL